MGDGPCQYPVVFDAGMCCGHDPCDVEWYRPCDKFGGCLDRATCGNCAVPLPADRAQHEAAIEAADRAAGL
jgi:hypothetical protein